MNEQQLAALGIWRIPIPIPFVQAGGPVNVYLLEEEDGGLCLFDAGLGSDEARAALDQAFQRLGRHYPDVRRIIVSHGHVDHFGNAQNVVERAGGTVPVYAHAADIGKMAASGIHWRDRMTHYGAFFLRLGVPPEVLAVLAEEGGRGQRLAQRIREVRAVGEGERLRFRHFEGELLHMPGHTSGLLCLWIPEHRVFLADDHLLEKISPNPLIELGPDGEDGFFRPLIAYLASVQRLREMEVQLVLPGHGPPFGDHRRVIDALVAFIDRRQARIRDLLAGGPRTAYEVVTALFPRARPGDTFLTLSEAFANLELLEGRGEVVREAGDGPFQFRLAG